MTTANTDRRSIIGAGALLAGAGIVAAAPARAEGGGGWTPAREPKDDWMDMPGTRHRMVYDSNSAKTIGEALFYASNYYFANKSGYGLGPEKLGVILIARHMGTPAAYNDAIWAKYGAAFNQAAGLEGKTAELAKTMNPLLMPGRAAMEGPAGDASVTTLTGMGARLAVCGLATTFIAGMLAKGTGGSVEAIDAELRAGLVPGATMVAAGILAVERAQAHGYAFAYVG
ncbi:MAG: hypothetical protein KGL48_08740 [Sphingomonadales bacterium]|nr:hypothetical protein [Sphingomonadales bacterium]MDE2568198.1 hypothetical protein [Sphingomonadales bacterium]